MPSSLGSLTTAAGVEPGLRHRPTAWGTIVVGGLTAGVLDIADALIFNGLRGGSATRLLQAIASGLLGPRAYQGGLATAAVGLGLHFFIAFGAATCYFVASSRWPWLLRRPVISGAIFGLGVFGFMQYVVLPLAGFGVRAQPPVVLANLVLAHVFFVGLPIALAARRSALRNKGA